MAARSRGNGTNFDWLRKSCDINTCDLSPDGNPEKYGRPMKLAIDLSVESVIKTTRLFADILTLYLLLPLGAVFWQTVQT